MISRTALVIVAAVSGAIALTSVGCSGGTIAVGSTDQALQKKKDGSPTGDGKTCGWDDSVGYDVATGTTTTTPGTSGQYKVGDTFKSLDGCNDCSCTASGIMCTQRACAPDPGGKTCTYGGKTYKAGEGFKSTDGCNSCGCQADGSVACTEMACAPALPCKATGCSGQICSDEDIASTCEWREEYACYKTAICERGTTGACGWRNTPELTSCLASK